MAWTGNVHHGRAVDDKGHPVAGASVSLVDSAGRVRGAVAPTDARGEFELRTLEGFPPDIGVFLAHPDFVRTWGPIPPTGQDGAKYEMRRKASAFRTQLKGHPHTRMAFVERDSKGLVAVFERKTDSQGMVSVGKDPSCSYRILPFVETGGALKRVTDTVDVVDLPEFPAIALDLRYKSVTLLRQTDFETTYFADPNIHLRFFYVPKSFDDAVSFAPLADAHETLRDKAYELQSEVLCTLKRAGVSNGIGYVAYEVPGESLEDAVGKSGPLSEGECVALHKQLGSVLPLFEKRGIWHGNIAPRFVYRSAEGWRLAPPCPALPIGSNFPVAHRLHEGPGGTDAFGLGCTIHFAATGKVPQFSEETKAPPDNVAGILEIRRKYRPIGRPAIDGIVKPLVEA